MDVAILVDIKKETDRNWRFIFESPLYDKLDFIPGQLIQLHATIPGEVMPVVRNYSVASWPDSTNKFELIVTYLPGGAMSEYLFNYIKVGDEIVYRGPMGIFTLPENLDERDIYLVSTGSGISPFRSMIGWINQEKIELKRNIKLFFGTRKVNDILYSTEMLEYQFNIPNFEFVPTLSQETDYFLDQMNRRDLYKKGYVHEHYLKLIDKLDHKPLVYFCGWNKMIAEGRQHLKERGFEMGKDIRVEIFG